MYIKDDVKNTFELTIAVIDSLDKLEFAVNSNELEHVHKARTAIVELQKALLDRYLEDVNSHDENFF